MGEEDSASAYAGGEVGDEPGLTVRVVGEFDAEFLAEVSGFEKAKGRAKGKADAIFLLAADRGALGQVRRLAAGLQPAGGLWVVYPKGVAEIREIQVIEAGRAAGLKDVKVASFSATHTALRFVISTVGAVAGDLALAWTAQEGYPTLMLRLAGLFLACWLAGWGADKVTVLKAARLFDAKGEGVVSPGFIVVTNNKITAVGGSGAVPAGAEVIDLGRRHAAARLHGRAHAPLLSLRAGLPGCGDGPTQEGHPGAHAGRGGCGPPDVDGGLHHGARSGLERLYSMSGCVTRSGPVRFPGPRMLVSVHALGSTGGHCDPFAGFVPGIFGRESGIADGVINSPDQARLAVRYNINNGADVIKTCATGGVLSLTDDVDTPQLTQAELDALIDEAHALRRKVAAHAHGATGAKRAIRAGIDSIEHGTFLDDEALDMMKARGTYYVPTLMAAQGLKERLSDGYVPPAIEAKARAAMAALDGTVRKALAKGVKIAVGTDAAVYPHGRNAGEFVDWCAWG